MAPNPPRRPTLQPYGGPEEFTPRPETIAERLVRVEMGQQQNEKDIAALKADSTQSRSETRELTDAVKTLVERKKIHDKLIFYVLVIGVGAVIALLWKTSVFFQAGRLVP